MYMQTWECGVIFLKPIILPECADEIYDFLILPRGYPADDLRMSYTVCPVQIAHSRMVFDVFRQHPCSLISLCDVHGVAECL